MSDTALAYSARHGVEAHAALSRLTDAVNRGLIEGEHLTPIGVLAGSEAAVAAGRTIMHGAAERQREALESPGAETATLEWQGLPQGLQEAPSFAEARAKAGQYLAWIETQAARFGHLYPEAAGEVALAVGWQAASRDMFAPSEWAQARMAGNPAHLVVGQVRN